MLSTPKRAPFDAGAALWLCSFHNLFLLLHHRSTGTGSSHICLCDYFRAGDPHESEWLPGLAPRSRESNDVTGTKAGSDEVTWGDNFSWVDGCSGLGILANAFRNPAIDTAGTYGCVVRGALTPDLQNAFAITGIRTGSVRGAFRAKIEPEYYILLADST